MTDEQIEKALECCTSKSCGDCKYVASSFCYNKLKTDALALIKRQREEIARVRAEAIREFAERVDGVLDLFAKGLIEELELYDKIAELKREMTEEQK